MGDDDDKKEHKPQTNNNGSGGRRRWNNKRGGSSNNYKFKGKTKEIEDDIFDLGGTHDAALFARSLKNISDYIQLKYNNDVSETVRNMKALTIAIPDPPKPKKDATGNTIPVSDTDFYLWKRKHSKAQDRADLYDEHMKNAYTLIFHQCSPALKTELEGSPNFETIRSTQDVLALLKLIQGFCCSFDTKTQGMMATVEAHKRAYLYFQKDGIDNQTYHREFMAHIETIETYGGFGAIGVVPSILETTLKAMEAEGTIADADNPTQADLKKATEKVREEYLAALFLSGANSARYESLREHLSNLYAMGDDKYPKTVVACLAMLDRYSNKATARGRPHLKPPAPVKHEPDDVVFAQSSSPRKQQQKEKRDPLSNPDDDASTNTSKTNKSASKRHPTIKCLRCGQVGHVSTSCPTSIPEQLHTMADDASTKSADSDNIFILAQSDSAGTVNKNYVLLDSQSTVNQFVNPAHVTNPRTAAQPVTIHCNAGTTSANTIANFGNTPVYLNESGIANVLSLKQLGRLHRITYDSWDRGGVFMVHTPSGIVEFIPDERGLHYLDLAAHPNAAHMFTTTTQAPSGSIIKTIRDNYEGFTKREVIKAHEARRLQAMMGCPSDRDFEGVVREKLLPNCPVTVDDIRNAHTIFGPDLASLRGKTVRRKPEHVRTDYVAIPKDIIAMNADVTLVADVMFVNGIAFLVTLSRRINLITIEHAPTRTATQLSNLLQRVVQVYLRAGFHPRTIMMDMEFDKVKDKMPSLVVNTTAAREHVAEIERKIRVIKERARGIVNTLPFTRLPKRILVELLHFVVMWLNNFPVANGISTKYSPREFILRHKFDTRLHCRAPFGAYCEVHDDLDTTNTMQRRTHPAICMGPTGNLQGSYKFFSLESGQRIIRRNFTELPTTDSIRKQVEKMAQAENRSPGLSFTNRHGADFHFTNDDLDEPLVESLVEQSLAPFPDIPAEFPGVYTAVTEEGETTAHAVDSSPTDWPSLAEAAAANSGINFDTPETTHNTSEVITVDDNDAAETPPRFIPQYSLLPKVDPETTTNTPTNTPIAQLVPPTNTPSTPPTPPTSQVSGNTTNRPSRNRRLPDKYNDYELYTTVTDDNDTSHPYVNAKGHTVDLAMEHDTITAVCHHVMVHYAEKIMTSSPIDVNPKNKKQYGLTAGLKRFGKRGEEALMKELRQFHVLQCFTPVDPATLTKTQRTNALASLLFLTEKRNGDIKARGCADGRKQREHIAKEESTSPTVSTDALFITSTIAAHERRDVASTDIPGAFLHADTDQYVLMRLDGVLAELMVQVAPSIYRPFITTNPRGKPVLYVTLQKALYGLLKSALLFYRKLVADLTTEGFTLNPYDPCVANKMVNGTQMTVVWHVDDLIVSHKQSTVVTKFLTWIQALYETPDKKMVATRGPKHDYLGMTLEFSKKGFLTVGMDAYVAKVIKEFPEEITGVSPSPAADHLYQVRDPAQSKLLDEDRAVAFHHTVAQLLFASTRARRDIQVAVAFLTTRVKSPDEDDWGKLKRVLKYLNGTKHLKLTLTVDSLSTLKWYVDGSHQTHEDCRGHTGALFTMGKGAITSSSRKQKINTKSSTETELVAVDDKLGDILWTRHFIEAQGYKVDENIVYQDNMSSLSLEKNGRVSSSPRTKHIKAKFFLVKDKSDVGDIHLKYCPTETMWADVLTKPLQGAKFRQMRAFLMNCPIDYAELPESSHSLPMKRKLVSISTSPRECVVGKPVHV